MKQVQLTESDLLAVSTTQQLPLGFRAIGENGNAYRYVKAGGTVGAGRAVIAPDNVANHLNGTLGTHAIGVSELNVTVGATAVTADQYKGGLLVINAGTGAGQSFRIKGNTAAGSGGTTKIQIEGALVTATATASSKANLYPNEYNGVTTSATAAKVRVGVSVRDMTDGQYGWVLTRGVGSLLVDGTAVAIADPVIPSTSVAGAVIGIGTVAVTDQILGYAVQAGTNTEYCSVDVRID